ncbi:hypothetical protein U1Q18_034347 [Sarracenia purpurea var. burkii]
MVRSSSPENQPTKVTKVALIRSHLGFSPPIETEQPEMIQEGMGVLPVGSNETLAYELEATDEQPADVSSDEVEEEMEISDVMVRTAKHDIGMAVQKFKNMKDTQDAQRKARKGKQVLDAVDEPFPHFVPRTVQQRGFGQNGGRGGRFWGRGDRPPVEQVVWKEKSKDDQEAPLKEPNARQGLPSICNLCTTFGHKSTKCTHQFSNKTEQAWTLVGKGKGVVRETQPAPSDMLPSSSLPSEQGNDTHIMEGPRGDKSSKEANKFACLQDDSNIEKFQLEPLDAPVSSSCPA